MLYHLFKYFDNVHNLPGAGMFQYISFRAAAAIIIALLIVIVFGRNIINFLRRKQIGEEIRDLGLEGQLQKKGTPTMGGVIILLAILIPVLLFGQLEVKVQHIVGSGDAVSYLHGKDGLAHVGVGKQAGKLTLVPKAVPQRTGCRQQRCFKYGLVCRLDVHHAYTAGHAVLRLGCFCEVATY